MLASAESGRFLGPEDATFADTYWVDVDVALSGIVRRQLPSRLKPAGHRSVPLLQDCILEGVGAVASAPREASSGGDKNQFSVRISRNTENGTVPAFEQPDGCQVVWDRRADRAWRSTIYVSDFIMRHIVEFFVTKRIDSVRLSIQISKWEGAPAGFPASSGSILSEPDFLPDPHTRCRLLSIYTSKGRIYPP